MSKTEARLLLSFLGGCVVLFLPFLWLKLFGIIDWDWKWVTAPLWMPLAFVFALGQIINLFKYHTKSQYH